MEQLDTEYLREVLSILKEAGTTHFKCADFSVAFETECAEEEDEESEPATTDVRGFVAPNSLDDDEDEDLDSPESMHKRAYRGSMPTLFPKPSK